MMFKGATLTLPDRNSALQGLLPISRLGFLLIYGLFLGGLIIKWEIFSLAIVIGMMASAVMLLNAELALYGFFASTQLLPYFRLNAESFILLILSWILYIFRNKPHFLVSTQSKLLFLLVIWTLISSAFLAFRSYSQALYLVTDLFIPIMLYFVIIIVFNSRERLMRFITFLLLLGACLAFLGAMQLYTQTPFYMKFTVDPFSIRLPGGGTGDPVQYGTQITFFLMLCFAMFIGEPAGQYKKFLLFILISLIFVFLASLNRSAMLGVAVGAILMLFLNRKGGIKLFLGFLIGMVILSQTPIIGMFKNQVISIWTTIYTQTGHFGGRIDTSLAGLEVLRDNPVFLIIGGGISQYTDLIKPYVSAITWKLYATSANSQIVFLVELGLPGFIIILSVFWLTFKELWGLQTEFKKAENYKMLYLTQGLFVSFFALNIISLANSAWYNQIFWINIALAAAIKNLYSDDKGKFINNPAEKHITSS